MGDDASKQIDAIIANAANWRGEILSNLRSVIVETDPRIYEEVKWKKPSKPEGVSVWSFNGNICIGEMLKNAVRLTFPSGAFLDDPTLLFNTRIDSKSVRAIDIQENEAVDKAALQALIRAAMQLNAAK